LRKPTSHLLAISLFIGGCAAQAPAFVREAVPNSPALTQVIAETAAHSGRKVRWGGNIEQSENLAQEAWLEIVERPLDSSGRPRDSDQSGGRFIAKVAGFFDPVIYARGRDITVTGVVDGDASRKIGGFDYRYIVVKVEAVYLWSPLIPITTMYYDPLWDDPWYPFWPPRYHRMHR